MTVKKFSGFQVFIGIPNEEERFEMLSSFCCDVLSKEKLTEIARKTPGFVIADLKLLVKRAKLKVINQKGDKQTKQCNLLLQSNEFQTFM